MDKVLYYDRNGNLRLTLNEDPYWIEDGVFKDWEWEYEDRFNRFRNFRRAKKEYPFTIIVVDDDGASRDNLCTIFSEDVEAGEAGHFEVNGWKLPCFVVAAERSLWANCKDYKIDFKIISKTSTWVRETTTTYMSIASEELVDLGRDYSLEENDTAPGRGYAIDSDETASTLIDSFGAELADAENDVLTTFGGTSGVPGYGYSVIANYSQTIVLPADGNGFKVTFLGPCTDPEIYLDGKPVRVYTSILSGEKLEITSNGREKTIYKISAQGVKTSAFVYRDKEHSPFFSIGKNTELTYGDISFDFTTIEQRSEPAWI